VVPVASPVAAEPGGSELLELVLTTGLAESAGLGAFFAAFGQECMTL
jgi:hypothetical protein